MGQLNLGQAASTALEPRLSVEGFDGPHETRTSLVEFRKSHVVLTVEYYVEEPPPRSVVIGLGIRQTDGTIQAIGLWELIPVDDPAARYGTWRFATQEELIVVLRRIVDDALMPFASSYWREPGALGAVIEASVGRRLEEHARDVRRRGSR